MEQASPAVTSLGSLLCLSSTATSPRVQHTWPRNDKRRLLPAVPSEGHGPACDPEAAARHTPILLSANSASSASRRAKPTPCPVFEPPCSL